MDLGLQTLSDLTVYSKYAKYIPELKRRETWDEIVDRYQEMMIKKYPYMKDAIVASAVWIREKKVLPSMRALQFAGPAAEVNNARIYNCCFLPIDSVHCFSETMFLLLGGTGVGYSVQKHHVAQLPTIKKQETYKHKTFLIEDSIMGWADAVKVLMKFYFEGGLKPKFDFRAIRKKGARLITAGGKAPGPEPLKLCLTHIDAIMERKQDGEQLSPLECHDILCHIANSVLAGGIRRSAMISLFSHDDEDAVNTSLTLLDLSISVTLLRSISLIILAAWVVKLIEVGRNQTNQELKPQNRVKKILKERGAIFKGLDKIFRFRLPDNSFHGSSLNIHR